MRLSLAALLVIVATLGGVATADAAGSGPFRVGSWSDGSSLEDVERGFLGFELRGGRVRGFVGRVPARCEARNERGSFERVDGEYLIVFGRGGPSTGRRDASGLAFRGLRFDVRSDLLSSGGRWEGDLMLDGRGQRAVATLLISYNRYSDGELTYQCTAGFDTAVRWRTNRRLRLPSPD